MPEKYSGNKREHTLAKVVAGAALAGAGMSVIDGFRTVLVDHRTNTHRSTKLHPSLKATFDFLARSIGQKDSRLWPDAHLDHHAFADVALFPFLRISRAINWVDAQREAGNTVDVEIPSEFSHLDPLVNEGKYPLKLVKEIGDLAELHVENKLGDLYKSPKSYTEGELHAIFHQERPDYHYKPYKRKKRKDYTSDELATLILQDPHSPAYADPNEKNGVRTILRKGLMPYLARTSASRAYPEIISPYAQLPEGQEPKSVWPAVATGVLLPGVAVLLGRGKYKPKDFGIAMAASAAFTASRVLIDDAGSMAVNSWGHSGENVTPRAMWEAAVNSKFKIALKEDGTVSSYLKLAGPLTWLIHAMTQDEVFKQGEHHDHPDWRKYTDKEGLAGVVEAPVGTFIDVLARSEWFKLIEEGDSFDLEEGRPDAPHPATVKMQGRRRIQYREDHGIAVIEEEAA
jgi:hypothetical protein